MLQLQGINIIEGSEVKTSQHRSVQQPRMLDGVSGFGVSSVAWYTSLQLLRLAMAMTVGMFTKWRRM
jgi:hypothetical protein